MKLKGILLTAFLAAGLTGLSFAGLYDDWPDDAICMWLDMKPTHEGYLGEAEKRSLTCEDGKAVAGSAKTSTGSNSTSKTKSKASSIDSDITYDVVFSAAVLKELLNRVVSKTNYDFSKHKLANNDNNSICRFGIRRIVYDDSELGRIENWDIAKGTINIKGSDVEFGEGSSWQMGGLSTDPSYLRDEVNIKLTEDGHLVGKMAYFNLGVKLGEVSLSPLYVTLTKHKRSIPIDLTKHIDDQNWAEIFIDVEDWAGGVMYVWKCYEVLKAPADLTEIEESNAFDGKYAFKLLSDPLNIAKHQIGSGYFEIIDGIITVSTEDRVLEANSNKFVTNKYYNKFKGRIDKNGEIQANFIFNPCWFGSKCYVQEDNAYKTATDDDKNITVLGNINKLKLKGEFLVGTGPNIVKIFFELKPKTQQ